MGHARGERSQVAHIVAVVETNLMIGRHWGPPTAHSGALALASLHRHPTMTQKTRPPLPKR
eukprot:scaffold39723_cov33-Tisochrysis_lutea.AAC.2